MLHVFEVQAYMLTNKQFTCCGICSVGYKSL